MSDFLGNLAARSLGRAEVLRTLPRVYGAPVAAPALAGPVADEAPYRPAPQLPPVPVLSPALEPESTTPMEPASDADPEALVVPGPEPAPVAAPAARTSAEVREPVASRAPRPLPSAERAVRTVESAAPTTDPPAAPPASGREPIEPVALPSRGRPEERRSDAAPVVQARTTEAVPRTGPAEPPAREEPLQFRVPERRQPEAERVAAAPVGRVPPPPAAAAAPAAEPPPPPVSITIGRLEVRVNPPPSRPAPAPKAAPAVMTLEEYLRSRRQGGDG